MKKILLALMVLSCAASVASATDGVAIQWTTLYAGYTHDAPSLSDLDSAHFLLDHYSLTWQLIYSPDATAGAPDLGNSANGWVSGNDTVWATRTLAQSVGGANVTASDGTEWGRDLYFVSGDVEYANAAWTTEGYIYQRAYEGTPAVGSWYFETVPEALEINPTTFQTSNIDQAGGGFAGFQPNQQFTVIPEPATMGLLGLGALVMALRRRRA